MTKIFFYQSGPSREIEFDSSNPTHVKLLRLLRAKKIKQANPVAKEVGFEKYYNSDFGKWLLASDLYVVERNARGLIVRWIVPSR